MNDTYYSSSPDTSTAAIAGAILVVLLGAILLYAIPSIITTWKMYSKAEKPGWAALIPVYSNMVMAEIGKRPVMVGILSGVLALIPSFTNQNNSLKAIGSLASLVAIGLILYLLAGFIKQYNAGLGFWITYIFFPIVAVFLVGKVNYTGGTPATQAMGPVPNPANTQPGAYGEMPQAATPQYQQPVQPTQPTQQIEQVQPPTSYQPTQPGVQQPVQDVNQPNQTTPGGYPQA
ncbi:MAG: DUF5684 domain-containing protein [Candidatus Saccharimonadales bacterium]